MTDLTPGAYFPEDCVITVKKKGSTASTITTRVTNFTDGGGGRDTDSIAHFGGAYITVRKPREEFEVGFDVDINDTFWGEILGGSLYSAGSGHKVDSAGKQIPYKIKLEWFDPEEALSVGSTAGSDWGAGFKLLYYNAYGVEYTKDNAADDRLTGTVRFNLGPADQYGSGQRIEIECQNFDNEIGSGSYEAWETAANTLFGY